MAGLAGLAWLGLAGLGWAGFGPSTSATGKRFAGSSTLARDAGHTTRRHFLKEGALTQTAPAFLGTYVTLPSSAPSLSGRPLRPLGGGSGPPQTPPPPAVDRAPRPASPAPSFTSSTPRPTDSNTTPGPQRRRISPARHCAPLSPAVPCCPLLSSVCFRGGQVQFHSIKY